MTLPHIDDEGDEEMEIVEQAEQIGLLLAGIEGNYSADGKKLEMVRSVDSKQLDSTKGHANASQRVSMEDHINLPVNGKNSIEENKFQKEMEESEQIMPEKDFREPCGSENTAANMEEQVHVDRHETVTVTFGELGSCGSIVSEVQCNTDKTSEEFMTRSSQTSEKMFTCKTMDEESSRKSVMDILRRSMSQLSVDIVIDPVPNPSISSDDRANSSDLNMVTCELSPVPDSISPTFSPRQDSANVATDVKGSPLNSLNDSAKPSDLSIVTCNPSPVLKSPTPTVSPTTSNSSQKNLRDSSLTPETIRLSFAKPSKSKCFNTQTTRIGKSVNQPNEQLAASLQRGLDILDNNRQSSGLRRSSFRFSYRPGDIKPLLVPKVDVGIQTLSHDDETADADAVTFLCSKCKSRDSEEVSGDANDHSDLQLVTVKDWSQSAEKSMKQVPKVCLKAQSEFVLITFF